MQKFRFYLLLISSIIIVSCSKPNPNEMKNHLNGYWEIKEVKMPDGEKKDYKATVILDYIEVKNDSGIRTKVSPKLDGSFLNNGVGEDFAVKIENDSLNLYYKTPFATWKETVLKAEDSTLIIKNSDNKIYTYKKFKPFDLGKLVN